MEMTGIDQIQAQLKGGAELVVFDISSDKGIAAGCQGITHFIGTGAAEMGDALAAGCDTLVTGDAKYNDFWDAKDLGLNLIDAGHFPTEDPVCQRVVAYLNERFPELSVTKSVAHKEVIQYYVDG